MEELILYVPDSGVRELSWGRLGALGRIAAAILLTPVRSAFVWALSGRGNDEESGDLDDTRS